MSLDNLFLSGQIHYFLPDISTSLICIARMLTRRKVTKPESETLCLQDRDETEMFDFLQTLETETFKTEITYL